MEERIKGAVTRTRQDAETLMESGLMAGEFANAQLSPEEFYNALNGFPVMMANSLPTSRYPLKPRTMVHINARHHHRLKNKVVMVVFDIFHVHLSAVEIELCNENEEIVFPDKIKVIKEVTDDESYKNAALAEIRR